MQTRSFLLTTALSASLFTASALGQGADDCTMATSISGTGPFTFDTTGATTDGTPDPLCNFFGNDDVFDDVWFAWTAMDSGPHVLSLCGATTGDSKVGVHDGTCAGPVIGCNDDLCGLVSEVNFSAMAGQVYLIRVGNFAMGGGSVGDFTITLDAPVLNPANGHFYKVYPSNLSWTAAKAAAEAEFWQGNAGHLATFTDQAEIDWVVQNLAPGRPWIGLSQNTASSSYAEPGGGFEWVTGEPLTFLNWAPGEPNNTAAGGGSEEYVEMFGNGVWNDAEDNHAQTFEFLVEWESGSIGTSYCMANPNATGATGSMSASGSVLVSNNDLTVTASDLPNSVFGFFITSQTQNFVPNPSGSQGNLCLGGAIGRYVGAGQIMNSGGNGEISLLLDLTQTPQPTGLVAILPGETWNFQLWHRDQFGGAATSNFTDGLEVGFF